MRPTNRSAGTTLAPALMAGLIACASGAAQEARLGTIDFPTSGASEAQDHFVRGVLYLHSFEYGDAAVAFRRAQELDPDFAMSYWGEAMTYTHPVWNQKDVESGRAVLGRLGATAAARQAKAPTEREKDYLAAVELLYGEGTKAEQDTAYSLAMRELMEKYPDDLEAKAFYSLSLLGLTQGVRDVATYMRAAAIADRVFEANRDHPGAAHYLIHSFDDPVHAPLGLPAARAYMTIAPGAPHAQHMTTHIFVAMGMWDEVVSQNEAAAGDRWSPGHYTYWLEYGLLQQGRYGEATDLLDRVRGNMGASAGQRGYLVSMRAHHLANTDRWESPIADWTIDTGGLGAGARSREAFIAGLTALRRGEPAAARAALDRLTSIAEAPDDPWDQPIVPTILQRALDASIRFGDGDTDAALQLIGEATTLEDEMPFEFGPPVVVKPTHELAGQMLLELNRPAEAQREFEAALRLAPRRALSLLGLARAASAAGDEKTARRAYETLREVWDGADPDVPGLTEVRRFASALD